MKKFDVSRLTGDEVHEQLGALCYRVDAEGRVEVLLVTSRDTGRWVIPKGWPMPKWPAARAACREAFEEAGVEGRVHDAPAGIYTYRKVIAAGLSLQCVVTVFPVEVTKLTRRYPERCERDRRWFAPDEAAGLVQEPELASLLRNFRPPQTDREAAGG